MYTDYIELGPCPADEECLQTGIHEIKYIRKQAHIWADQLRRQWSDEQFSVKTFRHDFGAYCEVLIQYNDQDEISRRSAYDVEDQLPEQWDEQARTEMNELMKEVHYEHHLQE